MNQQDAAAAGCFHAALSETVARVCHWSSFTLGHCRRLLLSSARGDCLILIYIYKALTRGLLYFSKDKRNVTKLFVWRVGREPRRWRTRDYDAPRWLEWRIDFLTGVVFLGAFASSLNASVFALDIFCRTGNPAKLFATINDLQLLLRKHFAGVYFGARWGLGGGWVGRPAGSPHPPKKVTQVQVQYQTELFMRIYWKCTSYNWMRYRTNING